MKKRIFALFLAAVLVCNLCAIRPKAAAGGAAAILAIGVLAWQLIGVMSGQYDDTANAIGVFIESGVDGITNSDSPFQQAWAGGWNQICNTVQRWFDSGDVTLEDGKIKLTYEQYLELYGQAVSVMGKPSVEFNASYDYTFLSADLSTPMSFASLPRIDVFFNSMQGQSFAPVYYNDDTLVFGSGYALLSFYNTSYTASVRKLSGLSDYNGVGGVSDCVSSFDNFITNCQPVFLTHYNSLFIQYDLNETTCTYQDTLDTCYVLSNGSLRATPVSDIDFSILHDGLVTTTGNYGAFLKSVSGYTPSYIQPDLDDLSGVLPLDKVSNPGLIVDTNPSIVLPTDAVTVTDVPGVPDATLTEYMANTNTDIDVPSIIVQKFPFCIPYDFIRIIGVLCADPVPPVFRIPISTNPDNLKGFEGNQTFSEYTSGEDFKPMFEIDEEIVIDLSAIPLVQPICYTVFILGFVVLLIMLTPKLIQH